MTVFTGSYHDRLIAALEAKVMDLIENSYGNYIIQKIIVLSPTEESRRFCRYVLGHVVRFSMQKCSSNVVECAIKNGDSETRNAIVEELLTYPSIFDLLEDQVEYAIERESYVVCKLRHSESARIDNRGNEEKACESNPSSFRSIEGKSFWSIYSPENWRYA